MESEKSNTNILSLGNAFTRASITTPIASDDIVCAFLRRQWETGDGDREASPVSLLFLNSTVICCFPFCICWKLIFPFLVGKAAITAEFLKIVFVCDITSL